MKDSGSEKRRTDLGKRKEKREIGGEMPQKVLRSGEEGRKSIKETLFL